MDNIKQPRPTSFMNIFQFRFSNQYWTTLDNLRFQQTMDIKDVALFSGLGFHMDSYNSLLVLDKLASLWMDSKTNKVLLALDKPDAGLDARARAFGLRSLQRLRAWIARCALAHAARTRAFLHSWTARVARFASARFIWTRTHGYTDK